MMTARTWMPYRRPADARVIQAMAADRPARADRIELGVNPATGALVNRRAKRTLAALKRRAKK